MGDDLRNSVSTAYGAGQGWRSTGVSDTPIIIATPGAFMQSIMEVDKTIPKGKGTTWAPY